MELGMWIGRPGALREITDGPARFDRSPDINVPEFRALSGAVTTWSAPVQPRRLSVSWPFMDQPDAGHLERLARRVDGPGPVAVLDPLARNLLAPAQSLGQGDVRAWSVSSGAVTGAGGTGAAMVSANAGAALGWIHPTWPGFPVMPGMRLWWWAPNFAAVAGAVVRLFWRDAAGVGRFVSSRDASLGPVDAVAPAGMTYVSPVIALATAGTYTIGPGVLSLDPVTGTGPVPLGEGCPAMSVTEFSHAASTGNGAYRDVTVSLVEVTNAAG